MQDNDSTGLPVRPNDLPSVTHDIMTGHGLLHVVVGLLDSKPVEVFAHYNLKVDPCTKGNSEAICRAISLGLRRGIDVAEFVKQLSFIECGHKFIAADGQSVTSVADGISKVLSKYMVDKP